jgi:hypothetical protein
MSKDEDQLIASLPRPDGELRIQARTYRDKRYVDIRFFWANGGQTLIPTKKGVTLREDEVDHVIDVLCAFNEESDHNMRRPEVLRTPPAIGQNSTCEVNRDQEYCNRANEGGQ